MAKQFTTGLEKSNMKRNNNNNRSKFGNRNDRRTRAIEWLDFLIHNNVAVDRAKSTSILIRDVEQQLKAASFKDENATEITVCKQDIATALLGILKDNEEDAVCSMNFASHTNPGGGFLKGANAQEEALCQISALYPVLAQEKLHEYYTTEQKEETYANSAIYSVDVPFWKKDKKYYADVLTMAAVNQRNVDGWKAPTSVMSKCIENAYLLPAMHAANIFVTGAWGCGVFDNDPKFVAKEFKRVMAKYPGFYKKVVFVIRDGAMCNTFKDILKK